jgi:hypothetical protein
VKAGHRAKKLGGLAEAAGEEQHELAGVIEGFDQAYEGDDGGFAGLPTAVEEETAVVAFKIRR